LEAEADDGSVEIACLAEVFLSTVISETRGVVIHGTLEDKEDDAMMVASSARGGGDSRDWVIRFKVHGRIRVVRGRD